MKSLSFLIATDWVIDHFNGIAQVTRRLQELEPQGLALSIISSAELWEGALPPDVGGKDRSWLRVARKHEIWATWATPAVQKSGVSC